MSYSPEFNPFSSYSEKTDLRLSPYFDPSNCSSLEERTEEVALPILESLDTDVENLPEWPASPSESRKMFYLNDDVPDIESPSDTISMFELQEAPTAYGISDDAPTKKRKRKDSDWIPQPKTEEENLLINAGASYKNGFFSKPSLIKLQYGSNVEIAKIAKKIQDQQGKEQDILKAAGLVKQKGGLYRQDSLLKIIQESEGEIKDIAQRIYYEQRESGRNKKKIKPLEVALRTAETPSSSSHTSQNPISLSDLCKITEEEKKQLIDAGADFRHGEFMPASLLKIVREDHKTKQIAEKVLKRQAQERDILSNAGAIYKKRFVSLKSLAPIRKRGDEIAVLAEKIYQFQKGKNESWKKEQNAAIREMEKPGAKSEEVIQKGIVARKKLEKIQEQAKEWKKQHPESVKEYSRKAYWENPMVREAKLRKYSEKKRQTHTSLEHPMPLDTSPSQRNPSTVSSELTYDPSFKDLRS